MKLAVAEKDVSDNVPEKFGDQLESAIKNFIGKMPDYHEIVITVGRSSFVLETLSVTENGLITFEGRDKENLPVMFMATESSFHLVLSSQKSSKAASEQKRAQIGFHHKPLI